MSSPLEALIKQAEPWLLTALHFSKVVLVGGAFVSLVMIPVALVFGWAGRIWIYALLVTSAGSILCALVANKWSEALFARRAKALGQDPDEARRFWRTYDWDEAGA
jgi:hypothetical protein